MSQSLPAYAAAAEFPPMPPRRARRTRRSRPLEGGGPTAGLVQSLADDLDELRERLPEDYVLRREDMVRWQAFERNHGQLLENQRQTAEAVQRMTVAVAALQVEQQSSREDRSALVARISALEGTLANTTHVTQMTRSSEERTYEIVKWILSGLGGLILGLIASGHLKLI